MIYFYIYLIGFLILWGMLKYEAVKSFQDYSWTNILQRAGISLLSWFGLLILGLTWINYNVKLKPPKWL